MKKFKIRASAIGKIMTGDIGLSDSNKAELAELISRENGTHPKGLKMTEIKDARLTELRYKEANPELPEGSKSYCKEWLKETLYKRRKDVKNKYIEKGHTTEEQGFTAMCVQLGLGMIYKNEEYKENEYITGTCDIDHAELDTVFDNKSSWDLSTFPMFETENPKPEYEEQLQGYMHLYGRKNGSVVYTLNDIDLDQLATFLKPWHSDNEKQQTALNLIFTLDTWNEAKAKFFPDAEDIDFIEIPEEKRVKRFDFKYDEEFIKEVEKRVEMCRDYIETLIS